MQQADITLADAQGTPVNHIFKANGVVARPDGRNTVSTAEYIDRSAASAVGFWKIQLGYIQRQSDGTYKQKVMLWLPTLETVSNSTVSGIAPAPTVAYTTMAVLEITSPERSTLLDRQNLRKMIANLMANSQVIAFIESPERITG
jgi:hypothetical protein